jgi:hypothetical protein
MVVISARAKQNFKAKIDREPSYASSTARSGSKAVFGATYSPHPDGLSI